MPRHTLKLLVLLTFAAVAPASAAHVAAVSTGDYHGGCPYERAELAAAGYEAIPVTIEGDPADGSLFAPGGRSSFFAP